LNERPDAPFAAWNDKGGITQNGVRRLLAGFDIRPETVRLNLSKTAKGFARKWFDDAFESYLKTQDENSNTVTSPENIADSGDSPAIIEGECYGPEDAVAANNDGHCYPVTDFKPETVPDTDKEVMLI
jgi:hypothetical protein